MDIHEFFDNTKAHVADMRHRAILHNAWGIYMAQLVFGEVRVNSAGREYSVRDIGEDHVLEDLGTIPTLNQVIECIDTKHLKWLGGLPSRKRMLPALRRRKDEETEAPAASEMPEIDPTEPTDVLDCMIDTGNSNLLRD